MKRSTIVLAVMVALLGLMTFAQPIVQSSTSLSRVFFEPNAGEVPFLNVINGAKSSLKIEVYVMTSNDIFEAIGNAVKRGVNVQVILTQHPYNMEAQSKYAYEELNSIGAHVRWAPARFTYDHAKFMIADNSIGIFGTSNLTYSGVSQNFEANVLTKDTNLVKALDMVFEADWKNVPAGSIPREHLVLSPNSESDILWLINSAKKNMRIVEEEVPEGNVFNAIEAAAKRGVNVQLVEPRSNVKRASGQYALASLAISGVHVGLVKEPFIHAKMIVVDDNYLFIGSQNVSYTSLYQNREVGAILSNKALISSASSRFDSLWKLASTLPPKIPTAQTAFLTQIVSSPYNYMGKLVKTVGTVEAVFGPTVFVSYARGVKIAGLELWLGHVKNSSPNLEVGETVRIVGSVDTYNGQLEISAVMPPKIISEALPPLPFQPSFDELSNYNGLTVLMKGTVRILSSGMYISNGKASVNLLALKKLPKIAGGTEIYVEGVVINKNGKSVVAPTRFYSANTYLPILERGKIKSNPKLSELRKNSNIYYSQSITATGIVSAVVSSSNAYITSNDYGMRIYGEHGSVRPGDIVKVEGVFTSYAGAFEIDVNSVKITGHTAKPEPISIKTSNAPKYPEMLVKVFGTVSKAKSKTFYIDDGTGAVIVYVPKGALPSNGEKVNVVGIATKYKDVYEIYALSISKK